MKKFNPDEDIVYIEDVKKFLRLLVGMQTVVAVVFAFSSLLLIASPLTTHYWYSLIFVCFCIFELVYVVAFINPKIQRWSYLLNIAEIKGIGIK